jgi:hypothetical protein
VPARRTIAETLMALAEELDPEWVRALRAAGEDPQWHIASSCSMLDWVPAWRLVECRQRFLGELLRRLQEGRWRLIWLSDDNPTKEAPFPKGQIAALTVGSFDAETSVVVLGNRRHRVRVEITEQTERQGPTDTTDRVERAMRKDIADGKLSLVDLARNPPDPLRYTQDYLATRYGASRKTCRIARARILKPPPVP